MNQVKNSFELNLVSLLNKGLRPVQIAQQLNISLPRLSYHLSKLKSKGMVKKNGLVWEINPIEQVKISTQTTIFNPPVRGHAFIWKVQPKKQYNWKQILFEKGIKYEEKGISKVPRIILNDKKIWLGQSNITIFESESFFAKTSIESRKYAVHSLLETLRQLESKLGIQIRDFRFTPTREHFSLIKNELARQCNKQGEKINVFNEKGHWLSIDDSFNLDEMETLGSMENKPMETNLQVQKWWNEQKDTKFQVTPTFLLEAIGNVTKNQQQFAEKMIFLDKNLVTHFKVLNDITDAINDLKNEVKKIRVQRQSQESRLDRWMQ